MDKPALQTPVAFLIFNRPELTRRVFEEIRTARPTRLLVVADGPREGHPHDQAGCAATREIISCVDWPCEVSINFSDINLGCKRRVSSGLSWVFEQVERAIILEDDCLPHPSFFPYCEELLEKYAHDTRVFHISGAHFRFTGPRNPSSYYYSRYSFIWGWASWRRAWRFYDVDMKLWPQVRDGKWLHGFLGDDAAAARFTKEFESIYRGELDTWDYQWGLACWLQNGLSIRPHVNLISNLGFGPGATHTQRESRKGNLPTEEMEFPLRPPPFMMQNTYEDSFLHEGLESRTLWHRASTKLARMVRRAVSQYVSVATI